MMMRFLYNIEGINRFVKNIIREYALKKIQLESKDIKVINRYRLDRAVREFIKDSIVNFIEDAP